MNAAPAIEHATGHVDVADQPSKSGWWILPFVAVGAVTWVFIIRWIINLF